MSWMHRRSQAEAMPGTLDALARYNSEPRPGADAMDSIIEELRRRP